MIEKLTNIVRIVSHSHTFPESQPKHYIIETSHISIDLAPYVIDGVKV